MELPEKARQHRKDEEAVVPDPFLEDRPKLFFYDESAKRQAPRVSEWTQELFKEIDREIARLWERYAVYADFFREHGYRPEVYILEEGHEYHLRDNWARTNMTFGMRLHRPESSGHDLDYVIMDEWSSEG